MQFLDKDMILFITDKMQLHPEKWTESDVYTIGQYPVIIESYIMSGDPTSRPREISFKQK